MMSAMPKQGTNTLWTEAAETATNLDNLIAQQGETQNLYQKSMATRKMFRIPRQPQDLWRGGYCGG